MAWAARCARRRLATVRNFLGGIYRPDLHAKRINALSAATLGVMTGASPAVAAIGQALALARGLTTKHCPATIKMVIVLPHPGMLPSGLGIASPGCSRRRATLSIGSRNKARHQAGRSVDEQRGHIGNPRR